MPDFSTPAFSFVALGTVRFPSVSEGGGSGPFRSDYRCQFHYVDDDRPPRDVEVRVYFVGREEVSAGDEVPVMLAFLDWEEQRERCRTGTKFELREGPKATATGVVQVVAHR
jgi:translation elongation factor EF-Tu-like GTPase